MGSQHRLVAPEEVRVRSPSVQVLCPVVRHHLEVDEYPTDLLHTAHGRHLVDHLPVGVLEHVDPVHRALLGGLVDRLDHRLYPQWYHVVSLIRPIQVPVPHRPRLPPRVEELIKHPVILNLHPIHVSIFLPVQCHWLGECLHANGASAPPRGRARLPPRGAVRPEVVPSQLRKLSSAGDALELAQVGVEGHELDVLLLQQPLVVRLNSHSINALITKPPLHSRL
mmetsp:Transcript_20376/g.47064  ORF Transcript_20376/g.47064 Transcript_20376/m.47064 type:complete len:224 (-) Transcript_20376:90-761(-)